MKLTCKFYHIKDECSETKRAVDVQLLNVRLKDARPPGTHKGETKKRKRNQCSSEDAKLQYKGETKKTKQNLYFSEDSKHRSFETKLEICMQWRTHMFDECNTCEKRKQVLAIFQDPNIDQELGLQLV